MQPTNPTRQRQWSLLELHADALVIGDEFALTHTLPMSEIAGYSMSPNKPADESGSVDVILHNGDRLVIESPYPRDLVWVLDARLG